ncbi:MAG: hypothetical protein KBD01_06405 [Acidobacteria bacterium]|nr:hypothetical protein [Acidobacteriota bacterium]
MSENVAIRVFFWAALFACLAFATAMKSDAANVKDIILDEVDPGRVNGTVASYYDELTPELQAQFSTNFNAGQGYYITPVVNISWAAGGVQYVQTTRIHLVPLNGGQIVVPMAVTCTHSGCSGAFCTTLGCNVTLDGAGLPACTGASCSGVSSCTVQTPTCSKTETVGTQGLAVFGAIGT